MKSIRIFAVILALMLVAVYAEAENRRIDGATITQDPVQSVDKNGNPTLRLIGAWSVEVDGHRFIDEHVLMAFGEEQVAKFAGVQKGDTINFIGDYRKLDDGRTSYTLKALIQ